VTDRFDELESVLRELRQRHRQVEAPAHLAVVLSTATYASQSQLRWRTGWRVWAIAAAILAAMVAWRADRSALIVDRRPLETSVAPAAESHQPMAKPAAGMNNVSPVRVARVPVAATPSEPMAGFVALPGSAGLPRPIETSILQFRLRKGELRRYGFDIPASSDAEFVRADFVIGDDGLARAVRLVH
jgi:hypothetical protein